MLNKLLLGLLLVSASLFAHDVWLVENNNELELIYGHENWQVYNPVKVKSYRGYDANGKKIKLKSVIKPESFNFKKEPKAAMVVVEFDNGYWVQDSHSEFENVSKETASKFSYYEHTIKLHKSLYAWSDQFIQPVGMALEIIPLQDPFKAKDKLTIQVLFKGNPLPNIKIEYGMHGDKAPSLKTDSLGKAIIPVKTTGEQFFAIDYSLSATREGEVISYSTSLRYELK